MGSYHYAAVTYRGVGGYKLDAIFLNVCASVQSVILPQELVAQTRRDSDTGKPLSFVECQRFVISDQHRHVYARMQELQVGGEPGPRAGLLQPQPRHPGR